MRKALCASLVAVALAGACGNKSSSESSGSGSATTEAPKGFKAEDYPPKSDDKCNDAPAQPPGMPALPGAVTVFKAAPDKRVRNWVSTLQEPRAEAALLDGLSKDLTTAGFRVLKYIDHSKLDAAKERLLAVRSGDVVRVSPVTQGQAAVSFEAYAFPSELEKAFVLMPNAELISTKLEEDGDVVLVYAIASEEADDDAPSPSSAGSDSAGSGSAGSGSAGAGSANSDPAGTPSAPISKARMNKLGNRYAAAAKSSGAAIVGEDDKFTVGSRLEIEISPPGDVPDVNAPSGKHVFTMTFRRLGC